MGGEFVGEKGEFSQVGGEDVAELALFSRFHEVHAASVGDEHRFPGERTHFFHKWAGVGEFREEVVKDNDGRVVVCQVGLYFGEHEGSPFTIGNVAAEEANRSRQAVEGADPGAGGGHGGGTAFNRELRAADFEMIATQQGGTGVEGGGGGDGANQDDHGAANLILRASKDIWSI